MANKKDSETVRVQLYTHLLRRLPRPGRKGSAAAFQYEMHISTLTTSLGLPDNRLQRGIVRQLITNLLPGILTISENIVHGDTQVTRAEVRDFITHPSVGPAEVSYGTDRWKGDGVRHGRRWKSKKKFHAP